MGTKNLKVLDVGRRILPHNNPLVKRAVWCRYALNDFWKFDQHQPTPLVCFGLGEELIQVDTGFFLVIFQGTSVINVAS